MPAKSISPRNLQSTLLAGIRFTVVAVAGGGFGSAAVVVAFGPTVDPKATFG